MDSEAQVNNRGVEILSQIYLFTSKSCVGCLAEREYLEELEVNFIEVDVHSDAYEYMKRDLSKNGIVLATVPAIVRKEGNKMIMVERSALFL